MKNKEDNLRDSTMRLNRKYNYLQHIDRVVNSKSKIDSCEPQMFMNLPQAKFAGIGPKKSIDQTIDFINENITLASRLKR